MKILILCNNDLASLLAINLLVAKLSEHELLIGQSSKVGGEQQHPAEIKKLALFEQGILKDQLACQGILNQINPGPKTTHFLLFEQIKKNLQIPLIKLNDINQASGMTLVKRFSPDLILSIRFGKILQQAIIDVPPLGVINLHSGLLPAYQGVMATFWAMLNDEKQMGSCLHFIQDKGIDSGEIITQSSIPVDTNRSYLQNVLQLYFTGIAVMSDAVERLSGHQELKSAPQQGEPRYYGFPSEFDLQAFRNKGFKLF